MCKMYIYIFVTAIFYKKKKHTILQQPFKKKVFIEMNKCKKQKNELILIQL